MKNVWCKGRGSFLSLKLFLGLSALCISWAGSWASVEEIARNEVQVWKAYYKQDVEGIKQSVSKFLQDQYRVILNSDMIDVYTRAVFVFAKTDQKASQEVYQKTVFPLLSEAFKTIRSGSSLSFNPDLLAQAELAWWVARRQDESCNVENVGQLMQESYRLLYGGKREDYARTSLLRAMAARYRDLSHDTFSEGIKEEDWTTVETILVRAYQALPLIEKRIEK